MWIAVTDRTLQLFRDRPILPSASGFLSRPSKQLKMINGSNLSNAVQDILVEFGCNMLKSSYVVEHPDLSNYVSDGSEVTARISCSNRDSKNIQQQPPAKPVETSHIFSVSIKYVLKHNSHHHSFMEDLIQVLKETRAINSISLKFSFYLVTIGKPVVHGPFFDGISNVTDICTSRGIPVLVVSNSNGHLNHLRTTKRWEGTRIYDILKFVTAQSTPAPRPAQQRPGVRVRKPAPAKGQPAAATEPQFEEPISFL
ncbi:hypothetical protein KIW84_061128 [Lathyrus oleraceus]|uniref:Uncharacterized protein n=1 Tax=Pisum sativum TaxID=3888 RepID=A0A9D4W4U2_PEA|nr:hypothetical protein KIW84_061127 [Pisum sativum]KAI5394322.1 hypothetical protein KIW84_061128 [Pisum sativum]